VSAGKHVRLTVLYKTTIPSLQTATFCIQYLVVRALTTTQRTTVTLGNGRHLASRPLTIVPRRHGCYRGRYCCWYRWEQQLSLYEWSVVPRLLPLAAGAARKTDGLIASLVIALMILTRAWTTKEYIGL
jgi:hypothetical protein